MEDRIKELVFNLNHYTELYDAGTPAISDEEWDKMYFELVNLEKETGIILKNSPTQIVHYTVMDELGKATHNHQMLSLDKTKDWNKFLQYFNNKSVVGMVKCDGLTCSLQYEGGKLLFAETRGDGSVGEFVTHNALVMDSIPKRINCGGRVVIDGEVICDKFNFERFKEDYANPRNFAAGSIRLLDSKECAKRGLKFIAWNVVEGCDSNDFITRLNFAQSLGFNVVPWTSSFDWDAKEYLIERAEEDGIPIDGLVGRFNDIDYGESLGSTGHHSRAAYAFKFADDEYDTELLDIEWSMGRTGQITPVAIFKPVDDGESIITRASLHNISVLKETLGEVPFVGQKIKVAKMNQIIPQIVWAEKITTNTATPITIPNTCPCCGENASIKKDNESEFLYCENPECEGKMINRIDHYAGKKGLDIKGLSKATLEKLIDWNWITDIHDLYNLHYNRNAWINKPGFGEKSVDNILAAIEDSKNTTFVKFLSAIGIPMIGTTLSKEIVKYFDNYETFREAIKTGYDFTQIDKIAYEKAKAITTFDYTEADKIAEFIEFAAADENTTDEILKDKKIAITGSLKLFKNRAELQEEIEKHGGKVVSSVTKNTTLLVNNDNLSQSAKNVAANKLGIPIVTEQEFFSNYLKK